MPHSELYVCNQVVQSNTAGPVLFKTDPMRLGIFDGGIRV